MASTSEEEDFDLRHALYQSALGDMKDRPPSRSQMNSVSAEMDSDVLYQSSQLALLSDPDADTLVYLGAPPQQSDQTNEAYAPIARHFAHFHRIHSNNILSLGSGMFEKLLGPSSQFRTERRLRNQGVFPYGIPCGIKFLLDLRPPIEDEDAILLITELSCSSGILTWVKAQKKYNIPRNIVCGQDGFSLLPRLRNSSGHIRDSSAASMRKSKCTPQPLADNFFHATKK
jgi:hypothetical protein